MLNRKFYTRLSMISIGLLGLAGLSAALASGPSPDEFRDAIAVMDGIYEKYAEQIQKRGKSRTPASGLNAELSLNEKIAIYSFSSALRFRINSVLRVGGEEANRVRPYAQVLNSALKKLPAFKGEVRLGATLPMTLAIAHRPGSIVSYADYLSASKHASNDGLHQFTILSKQGKLIRDYSVRPGENEVVFFPGTEFKVLSRTEKNDGTVLLKLEELD